MDDLIVFLHNLLTTDSLLLAAFTAAGGTNGVDVSDADNRALAGYPRLVLTVDGGRQMGFGEFARPQYFDGTVHLETVVRQSTGAGVTQTDPLATLYAIKDRCADLLLGNDALNLPGVKGRGLSANWICTQFRQSGDRRLPSIDPIYKRSQTDYAVQISRLGI